MQNLHLRFFNIPPSLCSQKPILDSLILLHLGQIRIGRHECREDQNARVANQQNAVDNLCSIQRRIPLTVTNGLIWISQIMQLNVFNYTSHCNPRNHYTSANAYMYSLYLPHHYRRIPMECILGNLFRYKGVCYY